ncbi:MAG TPA: hypothetical protein VER32_04560 [Pyrinomonadaceae bacterium]|nr:hypothetical protein [Pyrinomonadaceae bacterium]
MTEARQKDDEDEGGGGGGKSGGGQETAPERVINLYTGNAIHLFLSLLSILILFAAAVAAYDTVVTEFPKLFMQVEEYDALQKIIHNILLIAIAAELGLLLLFHRTSSAVEVIIFVIARKIVEPDISSLDLLLSVAALAGLLVARYYFVPGKME